MKKDIYVVLGLYLLLHVSCSKDFLDEKPDKSLIIPITLTDFRALLDNTTVFNQSPFLTAISTDDLVTNDQGYAAAPAIVRNAYIWKKDDVFDATVNVPDWNNPYQAVYYANTILEGLGNVKAKNTTEEANLRTLRGEALFHRAFAYHNLVQTFARPYRTATAEAELGIPIRSVADVKVVSTRATLKRSYQQMIDDLLESTTLLPDAAQYKTRPTKIAAHALLARIYLWMQDYDQALAQAKACMDGPHALVDFNSLNAAAPRPFPISFKDQHPEVIYYNTVLSIAFLGSSTNTFIAQDLYQSYHADDLRKSTFFSTNSLGVVFKGNYTGTSGVFSGLALDELYLIVAECHARKDELSEAMAYLNQLMVKRWNNKIAYPIITAEDSREALKKILQERRKELVNRNCRWADLRRLNLEPDLAITLLRKLSGISYMLPPNDPRYVFPIPNSEIFSSGIPQNER